MRDSKVIELWSHDRMEMHGGENNGGARRCFCPASGSQAFLPVLDQRRGVYRALPAYEGGTESVLGGQSYTFGGSAIARGVMRPGAEGFLGRQSTGSFHSGHPDDPNIGANPIKQFDFVTGMPDLRWEHIHIIDCDGYDELSILYAAECLLYSGLDFDVRELLAGDDIFVADSVWAAAWGHEFFEGGGPDYLNYPPGIWLNANDPLNPSPTFSSTAQGTGITNDPSFIDNPTTRWATGGTGWTITAGVSAAYSHVGGSGTLTQTAANFARSINAGRTYGIRYTISGTSGAPTLELSGVVAAPLALQTANGTHYAEFTAQLGNFILTATSSAAAGFTIDDIFMFEIVSPGTGYRNRAPLSFYANNASFSDSPLPAYGRQLMVLGSPYISPGGGLSRANLGGGLNCLSGVGHYAFALPNGNAVSYGMTQPGQAYRGAAGSSNIKTSGFRAGDRYSVRFRIGDALDSLQESTGGGPGNDMGRYRLKITGLSRIFFAVCTSGVNFVGPAPTAIGAERLRSVPVGPAIAPRQLLSARMYAKLIRH